MIRVGRVTWSGNKRIEPSYPGFKKVLVLTASSPYGELGPYVLKDDQGRIMENIWQASKIYEKVPRTVCRSSRFDPTVIWDHQAETHIKNDEITDEYWAWREKLMFNSYAVRYPVGFDHRHKCLGAYLELEDGSINPEPLDYVTSRKLIYLPVYCKLAKEQPKFRALRKALDRGENLLILEVDGPHQEDLAYYIKTYNVDESFIEQDTILMTPENNKIMVNDTLHPYGHGYCLAVALLGVDQNKDWF